jgi:hypothetical protein
MRFKPERTRGCSGIDSDIAPPCDFVATPVNFAMMASAQGHGEFVADLAGKRAGLSKAQMMSIAGPPSANEASLSGNMFDVVPVAHPPLFRERQHALVDRCGPLSFLGLVCLCIVRRQ